jgi:hypothetical protein
VAPLDTYMGTTFGATCCLHRQGETSLLILIVVFSLHVDKYSKIQRNAHVFIKAQKLQFCTYVFEFLDPYMLRTAWVIFRGYNVSAGLKLFEIIIH